MWSRLCHATKLLRRQAMHPNLPLSQVNITALRLERKAVIYIRQSSPKQVREHLDSQLTQRTLVQRAQSLGWHPERIEVFDGDLGQSATGVQERDAFKALAAEVALGHVGIVFGWQVSRLARNNAEWYQLLDVAALVGTLIGDTDGVYDPRTHTVGKQHTQKIERKHLTFRTRIKRLTRKTICFSRSILMHDLVVGLFINRYEFGYAV